MHIFITYVGYNIDATWWAYKEIEHQVLPIDRTYIFCSDYANKDGKISCDNADEVARQIYKSEVPGDPDHVLDGISDTHRSNNYGGKVFTIFLDEKQNMDYDYVHNKIISLYTENDKPRVTMNVTNGNGKTKAAMCIAGSEVGASLYYVDNPPADSKTGERPKQRVEKITDCRALDFNALGFTEKKVLWAIKEMEDEAMSKTDAQTLSGVRRNSVDSMPAGKKSVKGSDVIGEQGGREIHAATNEYTKSAIWKHTVAAGWPKPLSAQAITAPVCSLEEKGLIRLEKINEKEVRVILTATGRIALSKMKSRPVKKSDS